MRSNAEPTRIGIMIEYQCWFCGQGIERSDAGAVAITLQNFWRWYAGSQQDDDPLQMVYAHSGCVRARLSGETMELDPSIFGDDG